MRRIPAAAILLLALFFSDHAKAQSFSDTQASHWFGNVVAPSGQPGKLGPKPRASCGWYMRKIHGGRYGDEYNLARSWARLPRTTLHAGAVVVSKRKGRCGNGWCGHVVKVVRVIDACRAVVQDNRGTYERNTCRNRVAIVRP